MIMNSRSIAFVRKKELKELLCNMGDRKVSLMFMLSSLGLTTIFSFFILFSPNPFQSFSKPQLDQKPVLANTQFREEEKCDLFKGRWVPDHQGSPYSNSSCKTIPDSKNCFGHGRKDRDFLNWRWKPNECDLPRFDLKIFLEMVKGKTFGFIGDSVARNHMESLLCLLSQEEVPVDLYKDSDDRNRVWHFPVHNFTLKILWTKFLVMGEERMVNGSGSGVYDLYLDKIDTNWVGGLRTLDYAVVSAAHWFFRPIYLHKGSKVVACVYCNDPNITDQGVSFAVKMAFRSAFNHIKSCKNCNGMTALFRTFSPSHFENGYWNTGGYCNRTEPYDETDINLEASTDWELRNMQVEEIEKGIIENKERNIKFGVIDITKAMLMRPDGHPGEHWGNKWMKGYNDCVHWCLPGPINTWNDFLLAVMRNLNRLQ